jgi:hypothetical protein
LAGRFGSDADRSLILVGFTVWIDYFKGAVG